MDRAVHVALAVVLSQWASHARPLLLPATMPVDTWDLLSSYTGLLGLATASIYAGAHGALPVSRCAFSSCSICTDRAQPTKHPKKDGARHDDDDDRELPERLSSEDAWLFPVVRLAH